MPPATSIDHPYASFLKMISDDDLYRLAVFLGSLAMLLIVLYHFLEVNAIDDEPPAASTKKTVAKGTTPGRQREKASTGHR